MCRIRLTFGYWHIVDSVFFLRTVWVFFITFFFNDTATTEIYTLSLHDALPILHIGRNMSDTAPSEKQASLSEALVEKAEKELGEKRSEEHTSELQSPVPISYAVFCLKKKNGCEGAILV